MIAELLRQVADGLDEKPKMRDYWTRKTILLEFSEPELLFLTSILRAAANSVDVANGRGPSSLEEPSPDTHTQGTAPSRQANPYGLLEEWQLP